jgi:hypothetical protein
MAGVADYGIPRARSHTSGLPRRRGAVNGLLLILLGAWGGLVPFFGPQIGLSYTADAAWTFTWAKVWLEVLPAVAVLIGAFGLIGTAARAGGVLWGWLAALGGAWFVIGQTVSQLWTNGRGEFGAPAEATIAGRTIAELVFFYGLGAVIIFLAGVTIGRFTVPARQDAAITQVAPPTADTGGTAPADADRTTTMQPVGAKHSLPKESAGDTAAEKTQTTTPADSGRSAVPTDTRRTTTPPDQAATAPAEKS